MSDRDAKTEVVEAVARVIDWDPADIEMDMLFIEDLGCQSLQIMEIVLELQTVFGIEIPDQDIDSLRTVSDAVAYVEGHKGR